MRGVTVEFRGPAGGALYGGGASAGTADSLGNDAEEWGEPVEVADVLVAAGAARDSKESNRPDGIEVAWTLVVPRGFSASLRGCQVRVPGHEEWHDVIGDPMATPDGQLRRRFSRNRIVEAARRDG